METVEEHTPNCWQQKAEDQKGPAPRLIKYLLLPNIKDYTLNSNSTINIQNLKHFLKSISSFFLVIDVVVVSCDPLLLTVHQAFLEGESV